MPATLELVCISLSPRALGIEIVRGCTVRFYGKGLLGLAALWGGLKFWSPFFRVQMDIDGQASDYPFPSRSPSYLGRVMGRVKDPSSSPHCFRFVYGPKLAGVHGS